MDDEGIGDVIRRSRRARGLTLSQVAERSGLSESFVSQFERGKTRASIASLRLLTDCLGLTLAEVFNVNGTASARVLRADQRPLIPFGERAVKHLITARAVPRFEVFMVDFEERGSTGDDKYTHGESDELIMVQQGTIRLELADEVHHLGAGDATSFQSDTPHRVVNVGNEPAKVLWVVSPPGH